MYLFGSDEVSQVSRMLLEYVRLPRWERQRSLAEVEAFGEPDRYADAMQGARASMTGEEAFDSWFAFERPIDDRGGTLADSFAGDFRKKLTEAQQRYLKEMRESCLRPYEILRAKDRDEFAILRDLWADELIPLDAPGRFRGLHGNGMAFVRLTIGSNGLPQVNNALTMPRADMPELLFMLRLLGQEFHKKSPELNDDHFFKYVTPWILRAWLNSFAPSRKSPAGKRVMQVKVILDEVRPQIWRRLLLPESITLTALSTALERTMGWESYHLHEFEIDGVIYGVPDLEFPRAVHDEHERRLSDFGLLKGMRFDYLYDFGDGWRHHVTVERYLEAEPGVAYPICLDGARACPPEDVGGSGGYRGFLKILRNSRHDEHRAMKLWGRRKGRDFDPESFDRAATTARLRKRVLVPA